MSKEHEQDRRAEAAQTAAEATAPHFITVETTRKRFWAECTRLTGLAGQKLEDAVHQALSRKTPLAEPITHVEDFPGDVDEALAAVAEWVHEAITTYVTADVRAELRTAAESVNHGDALGRLSFKVQGPAGGSHLLTVSLAGLSPAAIRALHQEMVTHLDLIELGYPAHGYALLCDGRDQVGSGNAPRTPRASAIRAEGGEEAVKAAIARTGEVLRQASATTPPGNLEGDDMPSNPWADMFPGLAAGVQKQKLEEKNTSQSAGNLVSFVVESVKVEVTSTGRRRYRVLGGRWKKWGAVAWPEVLEAVFAAAEWEVGSEHPVQPGLTAYCEPDDKGQPKRVVRIA